MNNNKNCPSLLGSLPITCLLLSCAPATAMSAVHHVSVSRRNDTYAIAYHYGRYDAHVAAPEYFSCHTGQLCQATLGNHDVRLNDYAANPKTNPNGKLVHTLLEDSHGRHLAEITYAYDFQSDVKSESIRTWVHGIEHEEIKHYVHDALGRLVRVSVQNQPSAEPFAVDLYSYDANGNLRQEVSPQGNRHYAYNGLDENLDQIYDAAGNVLRDETGTGNHYRYNTYHQLITVITAHHLLANGRPTHEFEYAYYPDNLLQSQSGIADRHVTGRLVYYYRGAILSNTEDRVTGDTSYRLGGVARAVTDNRKELLAPISHYYFNNYKGSVLGELSHDNPTQRIETKSYTPYGKLQKQDEAADDVRQSADSVLNLKQDPRGYDGEMHDPISGGIYLRARMYMPAEKHFLQRDSVNLLNRYNFANADPVNWIDPNGHSAFFAGSVNALVPIASMLTSNLLVPALATYKGGAAALTLTGAISGGVSSWLSYGFANNDYAGNEAGLHTGGGAIGGIVSAFAGMGGAKLLQMTGLTPWAYLLTGAGLGAGEAIATQFSANVLTNLVENGSFTPDDSNNIIDTSAMIGGAIAGAIPGAFLQTRAYVNKIYPHKYNSAAALFDALKEGQFVIGMDSSARFAFSKKDIYSMSSAVHAALYYKQNNELRVAQLMLSKQVGGVLRTNDRKIRHTNNNPYIKRYMFSDIFGGDISILNRAINQRDYEFDMALQGDRRQNCQHYVYAVKDSYAALSGPRPVSDSLEMTLLQ